MAEESDITVSLPAEHFEALSEVIVAGLKHAQIPPKTRRELRDWWTAEKQMIEDSLNEQGES
jgi:hypothetical protein